MSTLQENLEYVYGCFLGMVCGDAAGATLEFYNGELTEDVVRKAMRMPGGGILRVGKGQYTDDSELGISLAFALVDKDPKNGYPLESVASMYSKWYYSGPFDIGMTCSRAFCSKSSNNIVNDMMRSALNSYVSEANGALMRIAPLALWAYSEPEPVYTQYAKLDALLSHPNIVCQECNAVYIAAIVYLLKHHGDYKGAISYLDDYVNNFVYSKVKDWYYKDSVDIDNINCKMHIGHVKHAFTLAIYFLRNNESYENAIFKTLMKGGDTDTNGAIVGGLIGALHGDTNIPKYMKDPVLEFVVDDDKLDNENKGHTIGYSRPSMYNSSNILPLSMYLYSHKYNTHKNRS